MQKMKTLFLDTDILIGILHNQWTLPQLRGSFSQYLHIATTAANIFELYFGYYKLQFSKQKLPKQRLAREKVALDTLIKNLVVFNMDGDSADRGAALYHSLVSKGNMIESFDCIIAAIILESGHSDILTYNWKHFSRIEGLNVIKLNEQGNLKSMNPDA
ncbi:MAG: type II toxin-antitoxin system VapC family toxin [Promethearchaeota archaeon]